MTPSDTQQVLVRFENVTHVVNVPSNDNDENHLSWTLRSLWSDRTGWPLHRLHARLNLPFCDILVASHLVGGKGGFGTLLKGQSRQAGAKLTTDFGACRDLQGRRLRHVNDEIKLRKWRDMERRKQNGEEVKDDELWQTPSGLYNWHLLTPTWADISKKSTYRIKRQFQQIDREAQKVQAKKREQENALQESITMYVGQTATAGEMVSSGISDAIQQGLSAASTKKRKRPVTNTTTTAMLELTDPTSSLCTLSGDLVLEGQQVQSKSDFGTVILVLDKEAHGTKALYYEVTLVTGGLAQIGWASLTGDVVFEPNNDLGDGVGDDVASYAFDGSRQRRFHDGKEEPYGSTWKAGDRLGCLLQDGKVFYSLNGQDMGVAFETQLTSLFPAVSCNQGEILELHSNRVDCKYIPKDSVAVHDLIVIEKENDSKEAELAEKNTREQMELKNKIQNFKSVPAPSVERKEPPKKDPVKAEWLDLEPFRSAEDLEALGLDRLKGALMALQVKCGGSLSERAARLFSLKGLGRKDYPIKVRAKGFVE